MSFLIHRRKAFRGDPNNPGTGDLLHWWNLNNKSVADSGDGLWDQEGSMHLTNVSCTDSSGTGPDGADTVAMTSTQYLETASDEKFFGGAGGAAGGTEFSMAIWAQADSVSSTGNWVINWRGGTEKLGQITISNKTPDDDVRGAAWDSVAEGGDFVWAKETVDPGTDWHHYVMTVGGTNAKMYVDGVEEGADTNVDLGDLETLAMPFAIGTAAWFPIGTNTKHVGEVWMGSVWKKALSADEVSWLYKDGSGRAYSEL